MELELDNVEIVTEGVLEVGIPSVIEVVGDSTEDLEITIAKKEYVVAGDSIYIPTYYDDAPQWLKDLIDVVLNVAIESRDQNVLNKVQSVLDALEYVPMNQYTEQILQLVSEDSILNTKIETLNSNWTELLNQAKATIANVEQTYVNAEEASAIALQVVTTSVTDGNTTLGSTIANIQNSYSNLNETIAQNQTVLMSTLEGIDDNVSGNATAIQTLETYVGVIDGEPTGTGILADVKILQKQNDGVIETYTGTYDVMIGVENPNNNTDNDQLDITQEPYASWLATDISNGDIATRAMHVGDVYIKYSSSEGGYKNYERAYKFIKTIVDTTSPYATDSEGFTWALIVDTDAQNAYVAALNAYDLADDKRRIYVGLGATVTPSVPYDQGDLWLIDAERTVNGYACKIGDILRCIEDKSSTATYEQNDWVLASSYVNAVNAQQQEFQDWIDGDYSDELLAIQAQIDSKAESYYQETMPHAEGTNSNYAVWIGDLWKKPSDNTEYVYQLVGSTYKWVLTDVPDIVYDTIDGKKTIFTGNTVPTAIGVNDMWITGDNPVSPYEDKSIYVWTKVSSNPDTFEWKIPVKYTGDQYAIDIINGTKQIDLSQHIDSLGWNTSISTLAADVANINTDLVQKAIDISNLDGAITAEETARIQAILDEEAARIADIQLRIDEEARLDGIITAEEQARITAVSDLDAAYKEYGRIIALALSDGVLTQDEQDAIAAAQLEVNAAKQRLLNIETDVSTIFNDISTINTTTANQAIEIANLDNAITAEESARIAAILAEEAARISDINDRIAEEALLDGKITAEEQNRIDSINAVEVAYKEYSRVVTLAIADGVLTPDEQALITAAADEVQAAKDRLLEIETNANTYSDAVLDNFLVSTYAVDLINIGNQLDGVAVTYFQSSIPYTLDSVAATGARSGDVWYIYDDGNSLTTSAYTKKTVITTDGVASTATYATTTSFALDEVYKFMYTKTSGANADSFTEVWEWEKITDVTILNALKEAAKTKAAADRSIKNFTIEPTSPYYVGDTWMQGSSGDIYVCQTENLSGAFNSNHWIVASKYTDNTLLEGFLIDGNTKLDLTKAYIDGTTSFTDYVAGEIDKEVVVYSGSDHTTQTGMKLNDIYIEKTTITASSGIVVDVTNMYKYNGTTWVAIGNNDNITALADLTDGKRSIYRGTTTPQAQGYIPEQNDIWIPETGVVGYDANELYQYIGTVWIKSTKYTDDSATLALETGLADGTVTIKLTDAYVGNTLLTDYVTTQIDDQIGVYSGTTAPVSGQPSGVQTDDIYLWFTTGTSSTGTVYDITVTYKYNGTSWVQITTNDGITALADLADGKRTVFAGSTIPTTAVERDLWIPEANVSTYVKGEVYQYLSGVWTLATRYTEVLSDFVDKVNNTIVPALENQIDGKIEYWFNVSTDDPKDGWTVAERANRDGDIWYQVDTKASYYYTSNTNSWNSITDKDAIQALADAAAAKNIADSKITSYYIDTYANVQVMSNGWTTQQKLDNVGDLATVWNDSTLDYNGTWRWNGTNWVTTRDKKLIALASDVTNLSTELTNGINTWASADSTLENSLRTEITDEGARVESKFAYNSNLNINGVWKKSGFGLTTNYLSGSGTQVDPYVSEFWIDASRLKFTNSNQTGQVAPFTIDATGLTPNITFNGKVSFSNVTDVPNYALSTKLATSISDNNDIFAQKLGYATYADMVTAAASGQTIINGGYVNTLLLQAGAITADKIDAYAISGKTISGGTITGTNLYGTYIEGAVIKASYIDLSSTQTLTNWQQYTPADYPSEYDANFAKNNDGTLLVDSQGYVRLMGNTTILTQNFYYNLGYNGSTIPSINRTDAFTTNLYSWSNYTVSSLNRMIANSHRLLLSSPSGNWSSYNAGMTLNDMLYITTNTIIHTQIIGSTVGTTGTAYVKFNILGDVYECYTYKYTTSSVTSYSVNWYIKKNSVTLYSGNTQYSHNIHLDSKYGMDYGIFVGDAGYSGGYPMIKVKIASIDTTVTGLGYNEPIFDLIESTVAGNSYVYRIDIPFIEVV